MSLVWLFKEHRDLWQKYEQFRASYDITCNDYVRKIQDLEQQLAKKPVVDIPALVEELFQDQPYSDGRIPDSVWLTPGDPDRKTR